MSEKDLEKEAKDNESKETLDKETKEAKADDSEKEVKEETPEEVIAKLEKDLEEWKSSYTRKLAEFQNFTKRKENEVAEMKKYASEGIITKLLDNIDNLERAEQASAETKNFDALVEGVNMILRNLRNLLTEEGVEELEAAEGVKFNPYEHQAMMTENVEDLDNDVIVKVFQKGYKLKGKVIRPAMVTVNKKWLYLVRGRFTLKEQQKKDDEIHEYEKLKEILETIKLEYQMERNKKNSFETRAGFIIAFLSAIIISVIEKFNLKNTINLFNINLTFGILIKILSGIILIISLIFICFSVFQMINIKFYNNLEIKEINDEFLKQSRKKLLKLLIFMYRDIIEQHRKLHKKNAEILKRIITILLIFLISFFFYVSF